ncbi:Diaminopimelate decarboxylase [Streptomyces badius]
MSRSAHPAGPRHADVLPEGHYSAPAADLNALDEKVWSRTVTRDADGALTVGGIAVARLAEEFGTPAYFLDESDFRARCRAWADAFGPDADVFYAGKAFLSRAVVRWLKEEGLNLDVCSGGELTTALDAGMPAERIAFHGNNKTVAEIERAVEAGVGRIVLDSFQEIVRVAHIAQRHGVRQRVQIRVTVGVEAHTHEFIATAHEDQKFGIALADGQAAEAVRRALSLDGLELIGVHSHIGSQIFDMAGFEVSARRVVQLLAEIRDEHGVELPEIDLGGGLGIAYTSDDDPREPHEIAKALSDIVTRECEAAKLRTPRISVEPGGPSSDPPRSRCTRSARSSPSKGCGRMSASTAECRTIFVPRCTTPSTAWRSSRAPRTPSRCSSGSSASTARAGTSWSRTRSSPPTWRPGT